MEIQAPLEITIRPKQLDQPVETVKDAAEAGGFFGVDGFSFKDILDVINPFQQLPVVSSLYREETGDTLSAASRLAGGALLGGPVGFLVALGNIIIEEATGKDVAGNLLAAAKDDEGGLLSNVTEEPVPTHGAAARGHYSAYVRAQSLLS
ncbi:MAG: hypothetical protein AB7L92_08010 [Alphaproteobacteria bacterium]